MICVNNKSTILNQNVILCINNNHTEDFVCVFICIKLNIKRIINSILSCFCWIFFVYYIQIELVCICNFIIINGTFNICNNVTYFAINFELKWNRFNCCCMVKTFNFKLQTEFTFACIIKCKFLETIL